MPSIDAPIAQLDTLLSRSKDVDHRPSTVRVDRRPPGSNPQPGHLRRALALETVAVQDGIPILAINLTKGQQAHAEAPIDTRFVDQPVDHL
jgi:hypothetical protein